MSSYMSDVGVVDIGSGSLCEMLCGFVFASSRRLVSSLSLCLAIAFLIVLMMSIVYGIQWRDLFLRIRWQLAVGSACFS